MTCPNCGYNVPGAPFCVRCGEPLENQDSPYPLEGRGYAAAPNERWFTPRVISSLFPHLPRANMEAFRLALAAGVALILILCLFQLFPLALIVAAALVPFLVVLYLWDVDLYEDEPLPMLAFTVGWGIAAGILLGLAAGHVASQSSLLTDSANTHDAVWLGAVLPVAGVVLAIGGPLVLLPYRRFNDVLDGVTFGAACAVTLLGTEVITNSADFLHLGLKAAGDEPLWIARLLTLGVALPVLSAAAVATACGSLWLRFRSPSRDRARFRLLGSPFVAVLLAVAAVVGSNLGLIYLGQWSALAITAGLALTALVLLRRMIQLGLIEEAGEAPIGPSIRCPNCGRDTPTHSFCSQCGVSLRALPKQGARTPQQPPGSSRLRRPVVLVSFTGLAAATVVLSTLVIVLVRPGPIRPLCTPGKPCGRPPVGPPISAPHATARAPLELGTPWASSLGVRVRYPNYWTATEHGDSILIVNEKLQGGEFVTALVAVSPATVSSAAALDAQLSAERSGYLGLQPDGAAQHVMLGPEVGFVHGIGAAYKATLDQPPSPSQRVELLFEVATFGPATVLVEAVTNEHAAPNDRTLNAPFPDYSDVDLMMESFRWQAGT
jgi:hypothetical protein